MKICKKVILSLLNSDHNKGWFLNESALSLSYPVANDGDFAILGSTDTVWVWDSDTNFWVNSGASGTGDVVGPGSSSDNAIALYDGPGGKNIKNSLVTIDGSGNLLSPTTIKSKSNLQVVSALVDSASISINLATGADKTLLVEGDNHVIQSPSNLVSGLRGMITISVDNNDRVIEWDSAYKFLNMSGQETYLYANTVNIVSYYSPDGTNVYCTLNRGPEVPPE